MGSGPAEVRFWSKVNKTDDCWLWTAGAISTGYGFFSPFVGKRILAHRWSYEQLVGPIPEGLVIDHLCRVRRCVNPAHLEPVTDAENRRRGASYGLQNGMRTTCIHGHEFTPENTYYSPSREGHRQCRECRRVRQLRYYHRNKARASVGAATFTPVGGKP